MAGLMSLVTRVGLAAEDRLGLTDSPSVPEPGSQAEPRAGRAGTAVGLLRSGWSVQRRQLAVHPVTAGALCARAGQSQCQVRPGHCPGDRMGPQTANIPTPHLPTPLQLLACGCW